MCDCSGDASCVLRFCRAISLDEPKVADVRAAADCVEDLRGAAPDEVEAICAQWKVLAKGKFRRAVAALQAEVRQGADGAFDLDDAAPVTPAAREGEVRAAVARDGGWPEEAPAPEAPAPAPFPPDAEAPLLDPVAAADVVRARSAAATRLQSCSAAE